MALAWYDGQKFRLSVSAHHTTSASATHSLNQTSPASPSSKASMRARQRGNLQPQANDPGGARMTWRSSGPPAAVQLRLGCRAAPASKVHHPSFSLPTVRLGTVHRSNHGASLLVCQSQPTTHACKNKQHCRSFRTYDLSFCAIV